MKINTEVQVTESEELEAAVAEEVRMIEDPANAEEILEKHLKEKKKE